MKRRPAPPPKGQHFLHDPAVVERIVDALGAHQDTVLEIGPGRGVLTRPLAAVADRVVAVELDGRLVEELRGDPRLAGTVIEHADILARPLASWIDPPAPFLLAGNLPYAITSPVLFAAFEARPWLRRGVVMMQREVAERLTAGSGSRTYGILSVLAALQADCELLFRVGPGAFRPAPRVESAVVRLDLLPAPRYGVGGPGRPEWRWVRRVVRAAFGQRRKMIRNALAAGLSDWSPGVIHARAEKAGFDLRRRAETFSPEEFVTLAAALEDKP
jgi:16S rRNA (adenine1518-N6/adenine1519-N6)-dimethyltransferase